MTEVPPYLEEPEGTREQIMQATYLALCRHGYSDLTTQRIGDEFPKSKSLLYHHYDSKDEILLEFLEFMLDRFEDRVPVSVDGGPEAYVEEIVQRAFVPGDAAGSDDFARAIVELRAQAAHDPEYRAYFTRSDQFVRKHVARVVRSGVEEGAFREVDPRETAALFQVASVGAITHHATSDDDVLEDARAEFERYVRECLLAE